MDSKDFCSSTWGIVVMSNLMISTVLIFFYERRCDFQDEVYLSRNILMVLGGFRRYVFLKRRVSELLNFAFMMISIRMLVHRRRGIDFVWHRMPDL